MEKDNVIDKQSLFITFHWFRISLTKRYDEARNKQLTVHANAFTKITNLLSTCQDHYNGHQQLQLQTSKKLCFLHLYDETLEQKHRASMTFNEEIRIN